MAVRFSPSKHEKPFLRLYQHEHFLKTPFRETSCSKQCPWIAIRLPALLVEGIPQAPLNTEFHSVAARSANAFLSVPYVPFRGIGVRESLTPFANMICPKIELSLEDDVAKYHPIRNTFQQGKSSIIGFSKRKFVVRNSSHLFPSTSKNRSVPRSCPCRQGKTFVLIATVKLVRTETYLTTENPGTLHACPGIPSEPVPVLLR